MKNLEVQVTISRTSDDVIRLTFKDKLSSLQILSAEMTPHDFAEAVTGMAFVSAVGELNTNPNIGKIREVKTVPIAYDGHYKTWEENFDTFVAPYEVEGWKADAYDRKHNHHRSNGEVYRTLFIRYVDVKEPSK